MNNQMALVMLAAGRGSRFSSSGVGEPKPLIDLQGRPFFWWAAESVRRATPLRQMVFVVLEEHIASHSIDARIRAYYPQASLVVLKEVTSGAAETALRGLAGLDAPGAVAFNDCDHAFSCPGLPRLLEGFDDGSAQAALMCFRSANPAYSYARLDAQGRVVGTAEKQVVSPHAIAGCYVFADSARFPAFYRRYQAHCDYPELFLSGVFNQIAQEGLGIGMLELPQHCSFGTPEEVAGLSEAAFAPFLAWK